MTGKIIEIIKNGNISIPRLLLLNYKNLNITDKELILLIYLMNDQEFDPERISHDLSMKLTETLEMVDSLSKKDILKLKMRTGKVCEEFISFDELYNKLAMFVINEKNVETKVTIYDKFEKEFARTLSPMEYEIIGVWLDSGYSEEIIELALKEAVYNGVSNLRYIDKILSSWQKKGIKNKEDVKNLNKKVEKNKPKEEVFTYDWLNDKD